MAKNRQLSESLLARLHGKGSMSEVLKIERERLLKQSQQEMQRQLSPAPANTSMDSRQEGVPKPTIESNPELESQNAPTTLPTGYELRVTATQTVPGIAQEGLDHTEHETTADSPPTFYPHQPQQASKRVNFPGGVVQSDVRKPNQVEGLSRLSRVAGEDLSEFGIIVRHSAASIHTKTSSLPGPALQYYEEEVDPSLPFTAQRNLLACVRRLTVSWGALTCQIPLALLSAGSGIRNLKTLRKWLADLHARNHLKYTPLHGDLRGSLITLTPPPEVTVCIEHWWKEKLDRTAPAPAGHTPTTRNLAG